VPLHMLLPFVLAWFHRKGYFTWFKEEWVTYRWWKNLIFSGRSKQQKRVEMTDTKKST